MKSSRRSSVGRSRKGRNRRPLQDAKPRLSEVERAAQQLGPQRVTVHGRDAVIIEPVDEFDRMKHPVSGRDIVAAWASSPLAEVSIERMSVKSPVRDVDL
jgi:prevent-host-death family protein